MKKIINRTPITAFGRDVIELFVLDTNVWGDDCCEQCCYHDYTPFSPEYVSCREVHGCGLSPHTFFLIEEQ
jgi:hypothetical protein